MVLESVAKPCSRFLLHQSYTLTRIFDLTGQRTRVSLCKFRKRRGCGRLLAGAEGTTQWVTRKLARFACRSTPSSASNSGAATVTSDAGLLLPRELDERLGLSARSDCPLEQ